VDHNLPTTDRSLPIHDDLARNQIAALQKNARDFGITLYDVDSEKQGIVHVIGPELGLTQPGMTIVCGDSHTSTHGAFGALAFGIGTSQVEHVLATQCLPMDKPKSMQIKLSGKLSKGVTAKDVILGIISRIGVDGGSGHVIEYTGEAIKAFSMEERMTICNMSIEAGARAGMISPDATTISYLMNKIPQEDIEDVKSLTDSWLDLASDKECQFDSVIEIDARSLEPCVTWGTNPEMSIPITESIPDPEKATSQEAKQAMKRALSYMDLQPGVPIQNISIDRVFIGSCTNSRLSDLQAAAAILKGNKVNENVKAMVVPGSTAVKKEAEELGLDKIFVDAGFEWRESGCSMCLGMNPDILNPGERCASTSNRNFEGRQGKGGRTHLVSPETAAGAAIAGHFVDTREWID
jgi:3-isopropylmalate/(R)-2-methylmalate dehydratase large subunit|tara:strand:- start:6097 stop:7320 length:1224 start_codon:yes stop_codon:yes gene_type:complete